MRTTRASHYIVCADKIQQSKITRVFLKKKNAESSGSERGNR